MVAVFGLLALRSAQPFFRFRRWNEAGLYGQEKTIKSIFSYGPCGLAPQTSQRTFRDFVIHPCLSPDGKSLAFSEYRNGAWNIYETSAEGGSAIRQITGDNYNNLYPQYSPDQSEILYTQLLFQLISKGIPFRPWLIHRSGATISRPRG